MKKIWIIVIILILVVVGYMGRHRIKAMLGMSTPAPSVTQVTTSTSTPGPTTASSPATTSNIVMTKTDPKKGDYIVDAKGMTLYSFDKDTRETSNCNGGCATTWPPFVVSPAYSTTMPLYVATIKRSDNTMQYAYKGMPLYYYAKDTKAGDITGDGVGGVWHLVKP